MTRQEQIIIEIGEKHGLKKMAAEEIYHLFFKTIADAINIEDTMTDGLYDPKKLPVIHIDNFGKFKPYLKNITKLNRGIQINNKKNEGNS